MIRTKKIQVRRGGREYLPGLGDDAEVTSFSRPRVERWKRVEFTVGRWIVPLSRWKRIA